MRVAGDRMFQRMLRTLSEKTARFMYGRYGMDKLNTTLMFGAVIFSLVGMLLSRFGLVCRVISLILTLLTYVILGFFLFRFFSKNLTARKAENRTFLNLTAFIWDRKNRYYHCPKCKQTVRVPRGHGKICIKCPQCAEKFIRKS